MLYIVGFVEGVDGKIFVDNESGWMMLILMIYNVDILGICLDLIGWLIFNWLEFLNFEFKGKVLIFDILLIGIMDMVMVVEFMGEYKYLDKGNMIKEEIDFIFGIFIEVKKNG